MKKLFALILALALCLTVVSVSAFAKNDNIELIGADATSKGAAGQVCFEYIVEKVAELSDGKLTIDYHPNSELGGDADIIRQVQANDLQMTLCQTAPLVSFIPEIAVFDLPMVFSKYDGDTIDNVLNGENDFTAAISAAYEKAGLHLLGFLQNATYRLTTSNVDLSTLDGFKGMQIRTMENKNHMAFWTAIGAEPTPLAWPEVYIALQNGTIDAEENAADTCVGANFQEVQKYLSCTNHILYCNQICISKDAWDELSPELQDVLQQAVTDAIAYMRPQLEEIDKNNKQILVDGGMTLVEYDADFYDTVLNLDGVQALYKEIDENQVNGLGTLLVNELSK